MLVGRDVCSRLPSQAPDDLLPQRRLLVNRRTDTLTRGPVFADGPLGDSIDQTRRRPARCELRPRFLRSRRSLRRILDRTEQLIHRAGSE